MLNKNISFKFDSKIDSKPKLTKLVNKAYLENKKFFGQDVSGINVIFLYTRLQMDKISHKKTPDWLIGYAKDKHNVYIFSPSVFDKVSNHPVTDFPYTLTHEITHIFTHHLLNFYYPKWLNEGIAGYVAQQYKIRSVEKVQDFSKLHDQKNWDKHHNYSQAFSFTRYLIDTFGKEKTLKFLTQLPKNIERHHFYSDFVKFFNRFFAIDFNQTVNNWENDIRPRS